MPDEPAYERAMARKAELEGELREINTFLSLYRRFAGPETVVAPPLGPLHRIGLESAESAAEDPGKPPSMTQEEFVRISREILIGHGRPMTRSQLLTAFKGMGRNIGGVDEQKNLGTKIWRARDRIVNVQGAGYWPREIPCPAVKYEPSVGVPIEPQHEAGDKEADEVNELFN